MGISNTIGSPDGVSDCELEGGGDEEVATGLTGGGTEEAGGLADDRGGDTTGAIAGGEGVGNGLVDAGEADGLVGERRGGRVKEEEKDLFFPLSRPRS
jgi:hypothetical protein